jgi:hypothetical protein
MFKFKKCSYAKKVQILKKFKYKNCSDLEIVHTKKCSNVKNVQIFKMIKFGKYSNLKVVQSLKKCSNFKKFSSYEKMFKLKIVQTKNVQI